MGHVKLMYNKVTQFDVAGLPRLEVALPKRGARVRGTVWNEQQWFIEVQNKADNT